MLIVNIKWYFNETQRIPQNYSFPKDDFVIKLFKINSFENP